MFHSLSSNLLLAVGILCICISTIHANASLEDNEIIPKKSFQETKEDRATAERQRLINTLFQDYDKRNYPTNTTLRFGLNLIRFDIDEYKSAVETESWLKYVWYDSRLRWDPSDFGGETLFRFPSEEVWKPDLSLYNTAEGQEGLRCKETNVIIYSDGKVLWVPSCTFRANCNLTLDTAPLGEQKCTLKFGSWTFDGYMVDLQFYEDKSEADMTDFSDITDWQVLSNTGVREAKFYPCCKEPYPSITYEFTFQRRNTGASGCSK